MIVDGWRIVGAASSGRFGRSGESEEHEFRIMFNVFSSKKGSSSFLIEVWKKSYMFFCRNSISVRTVSIYVCVCVYLFGLRERTRSYRCVCASLSALRTVDSVSDAAPCLSSPAASWHWLPSEPFDNTPSLTAWAYPRARDVRPPSSYDSCAYVSRAPSFFVFSPTFYFFFEACDVWWCIVKITWDWLLLLWWLWLLRWMETVV